MEAITRVLSTVKKLYAVAEKLKDADMKMLMAELQTQLADVKIENSELKTQNHELRQQLNKTESSTTLRKKLRLRDNVYELQEDFNGLPEGTAFCVRCIEVDDRTVSLTSLSSAFGQLARYKCNQCQSSYA